MREDVVFNRQDSIELMFRIGMKGRHVDDIVEPAPCRLQRRLKIVEGQTDLSLEVRFGRAIDATADLTRNKQQIA